MKIKYPATEVRIINWESTDVAFIKNKENAGKLTNYKVYILDACEFVLEHEDKLYHLRYDRKLGSCSCEDFIYRSSGISIPCKHLIKLTEELKTNKIQIIPNELLTQIEQYCKSEGIIFTMTKPEGLMVAPPVTTPPMTDVVSHSPTSVPSGIKNIQKIPKIMSDQERDDMIEKAKAERFLTNRGVSYSVQGKERPDSYMIQRVANEKNISIQILEAYQNEKCAHVVVRAHAGDQYCDAVVHHDFDTELQLKTIEMIANQLKIGNNILREPPRFIGSIPELKEGAIIRQDKGEIDAKYYLIHSLLSFKKFALRDARTKCAAIAEAMLLNRDWRDQEDKDSENSEKELVSSQKK